MSHTCDDRAAPRCTVGAVDDDDVMGRIGAHPSWGDPDRSVTDPAAGRLSVQ